MSKTSHSLIVTIALLASLTAAAGNIYNATVDTPPRQEWNQNNGYCGEVSFIMAGLRFGQYCSQYEARSIASPGVPQYKVNAQLLLGVNAGDAARKMHLKATPWDNSGGSDPEGYLKWVTDGVIANNSIIMGVYNNEYLLYNNSQDPKAGDPQYDHIVTALDVTSSSPLTDDAPYQASNTVTISDNCLYTPNNTCIYYFTQTYGPFQRTREQANAESAPPYSLPSSVKQFGLAISGIIDHDGDTLPIQIATNINYEKPHIKNNSNKRPTPETIILTVTVTGLTAGQSYNLYRYDSFSDVPDSSFNANAGNASHTVQIQATAPSYQFTETIESDDVVVYRAVPTSAA